MGIIPKKVDKPEAILSAPIRLEILSTRRCNLRCIHCYAELGPLVEEELTTHEIKDIVNQAKDLGVFYIALMGGEPTIRDDFCEIVKHILDKGITLSTSTNGTLITKEYAEKIKRTGLKNIQVSLDGATPETNDYFRGCKGAFKNAVRGIKALVEVGMNVDIATTVTKINYKEIPEMIDLAVKLRVNLYRIMSFVPGGRGEKQNLDISKNEWLNLISYLNKRSKELENLLDLHSEIRFMYPEYDSPTRLDKLFGGSCRAGRRQCVIGPDGKVYPCVMLMTPEFCAGNIRERKLEDIWLNSHVFNFFRNITYDMLSTEKCKKCKFKYICNGACRAAALRIGGDFFAPDPRCPHDPEKNIYAQLP